MRRWRPALAALAVYTAAAVVLFGNAWADPGGRLVGAGGDALQATWFLGWTPFALAHGLNPFISDYVNYPQGINLMWNTNIFLPALLFGPVTAALGPVISAKALLTLAFAASAWCAMLALRRLGFSYRGAFAGGLFYGFSPYMVGHALGHLDLVIAVVPPLVVIVVHDVLESRSRSPWRAGVVLGFLAAAQLLTSEEVLASMALCGVVALLAAALLDWRSLRPRLPTLLVTLAVACVVALLVCAVPLTYQFFGPSRVAGSIQARNLFVADLLNFVAPTSITAVAPPAVTALTSGFGGNGAEGTAYLGVPLLLVVGYTAWRERARPLVRLAVVVTAAMALLSLGSSLHVGGVDTHVPLPFLLLEPVPLLGDMLPGRLALYVSLGVAVLLASFVDLPWSQAPRRATSLVAIGALAVTLASLLPVFPYPTITLVEPVYFSRVPGPDGRVLLVLPLSFTENSTAAMLWQAQSGMAFRMPEGYFIAPGDHGSPRFGPRLSPAMEALVAVQTGRAGAGDPPVPGLAPELSALGVDGVVLADSAVHRDQLAEYLSAALGHGPVLQDGVEVWAVPRRALR